MYATLPAENVGGGWNWTSFATRIRHSEPAVVFSRTQNKVEKPFELNKFRRPPLICALNEIGKQIDQ